jgi:hypothetical protein
MADTPEGGIRVKKSHWPARTDRGLESAEQDDLYWDRHTAGFGVGSMVVVKPPLEVGGNVCSSPTARLVPSFLGRGWLRGGAVLCCSMLCIAPERVSWFVGSNEQRSGERTKVGSMNNEQSQSSPWSPAPRAHDTQLRVA